MDTGHGTLGLEKGTEVTVVSLEIYAQTAGTWKVSALEEKLDLISSGHFWNEILLE